MLLLTRVDKTALLRRLFELGCRYSGQVLSYTRMLGQLQDAGNTTTLAHYLELLAGAGMLTGLQKFRTKPDIVGGRRRCLCGGIPEQPGGPAVAPMSLVRSGRGHGREVLWADLLCRMPLLELPEQLHRFRPVVGPLVCSHRSRRYTMGTWITRVDLLPCASTKNTSTLAAAVSKLTTIAPAR